MKTKSIPLSNPVLGRLIIGDKFAITRVMHNTVIIVWNSVGVNEICAVFDVLRLVTGRHHSPVDSVMEGKSKFYLSALELLLPCHNEPIWASEMPMVHRIPKLSTLGYECALHCVVNRIEECWSRCFFSF